MTKKNRVKKTSVKHLFPKDRFSLVKNEARKRARVEGIKEKEEVLTVDVWKKYVERYNPPLLVEALDKIEEKRRLKAAGVTVPETYLAISDPDVAEELEKWTHFLPRRGFVIKPSRGHGGAGVLLIRKVIGKRFIGEAGDYLEVSDLKKHVNDILSGKYSRGRADVALFEEYLHLSPELRELSTLGLPDIRVISFRGFPVMAMIRLPTVQSRGRANVHRGAIAAGISIDRGRIVAAVLKREMVEVHPDTGARIIDRPIPHFREVLEMAVKAQEASGLGFAGVDLTITRERGVTVLEVNRRPGLEIQNANLSGLLKRLRVVERWWDEVGEELSVHERVKLAMEWDRRRWRYER
ncbi:MAG: alpha-L-glutamate ligase-like protein [Thermoplasmata archaeon]|nr:alpha-L-glutamate ligase-like protein [Thermoplasmata archaeon]